MLNLPEFEVDDDNDYEYLKSKMKKLKKCLEANKKYQKSLEMFLEKIEETEKKLVEDLKIVEKQNENYTKFKYEDKSPFIEFYMKDDLKEERPKSLCLMRLMNKVKNKSGIKNPKKSNYQCEDFLSLTSDDDSEDKISSDFENFIENGKRNYEDDNNNNNTIFLKKSPEKINNTEFITSKKRWNKKSRQSKNLKENYSIKLKCIEIKKLSKNNFLTDYLKEVIRIFDITPKKFRKISFFKIANCINNDMNFLKKSKKIIFALDIYKTALKYHNLNKPSNNWTKEEDQLVIDAMNKYGDHNWRNLKYFFNGKSGNQIRQRWTKYLNKNRINENWKFEDDVKLMIGALIFKTENNIRWIEISKHFNGERTDVQIRERYMNILDPRISKDIKKYQEKVISLYKEIGPRWSIISKKVGNITDNACRRIVYNNLDIEDIEKSVSVKSKSKIKDN